MTRLRGILKQETQVSGQLTKEPSILVTMTNGARGSSAYEIWLKQGNQGTAEDFLESLKATTVEYELLKNKPSIEEVELIGNKTFEELGITSIGEDEIKSLL